MARDTITIRRPSVGVRMKLGSRTDLTIDLILAHPWFDAPTFGQRIRTITGQSRRGMDFQFTGERPILSATEGRAISSDTRKDCYTRSDTVGAGLGCYVVVTSGDLKLTYANLKRGSARSGTVRVGDRIGYSGNTGHCLEGDRKYFVHFEVAQGSTPREANAFEQPLEILVEADGQPIGKATPVPKGIIAAEGFGLGEWSIDSRHYRIGPCQLEVVLKEGNRVRETAKHRVELIR